MTMKLEMINARLPQGTGDRIDKVLRGGELRSAFIRAAVEAELVRREAGLAGHRPRKVQKVPRKMVREFQTVG